MKRLLTAAACAALLVAPALAQDYDPQAVVPAVPADCPTLPDAAPDQPCPPNLSSGSTAPFLLSANPAETIGIIASIDEAAGTVTLDDGKTYLLQTNIALNTNAVAVGQQVVISFEQNPGFENPRDYD